ncbi:hypothetical protein Calab_2782 [Caldithrix abyssi DSM 13497]|uniref:Uncharacterized protein n=1 Tax=Caldithrix abyssi DSM 13497 TaxID=880073 RepID=H1XRA8_CALAY|nr:hypothetical protein Calab_2782 [Caldithrix abyssi DSM 13497]
MVIGLRLTDWNVRNTGIFSKLLIFQLPWQPENLSFNQPIHADSADDRRKKNRNLFKYLLSFNCVFNSPPNIVNFSIFSVLTPPLFSKEGETGGEFSMSQNFQYIVHKSALSARDKRARLVYGGFHFTRIAQMIAERSKKNLRKWARFARDELLCFNSGFNNRFIERLFSEERSRAENRLYFSHSSVAFNR